MKTLQEIIESRFNTVVSSAEDIIDVCDEILNDYINQEDEDKN